LDFHRSGNPKRWGGEKASVKALSAHGSWNK
jgi:hypothetical protein